MRKTSKADLVHQLEQNISIIQTLPIFDISRTTLIRDDMPLLQSINAKRFRTFGEMALDFVKNQISCFQFTSIVVDIFDRYDIQNSIKKAERTVNPSLFSLHLIEGRVIPDWKEFISSGENIIRFLGDYIAKHIRQNSSLQEGQSLYLAVYFLILKQLKC